MKGATRLSSPKSRHEMHGDMASRSPSRRLEDFVPEGLNDRSQAIYCLERVQQRIRPVGHGLILTPD
jgi:hypothetical protein